MNTRLTSIGFNGPVSHLFEWIDHAYVNLTARYQTHAGDYAVWKSESGIQWWTQFESNTQNFIDFQTHFAGKASMIVRVVAAYPRHELGLLTGAFHAWVNPSDDTQNPGDYPIVFDVPDFCRHSQAGLPFECKVQLAAFPRELQVFDDETAFKNFQCDRSTKMAAQALIPAGLFDVASGESPRSEVVFSGKVLAAYTHTNPVTDLEFISAVVETYGGTIDLVTGMTPMADKIRAGSVVLVSAVVTGMIDARPGPPPLPKHG